MRARTRHMFSRSFKNKGMIPLTTFLKVYKVGDIVDIKANAAQQKGMPHKYYHGRTGIVYNVSPTSVGVIIYKVVGNRYMEKRVNLRIEHVKHSKCRQEVSTPPPSPLGAAPPPAPPPPYQPLADLVTCTPDLSYTTMTSFTIRDLVPRPGHQQRCQEARCQGDRREGPPQACPCPPPRLAHRLDQGQRAPDPRPHPLRHHHLSGWNTMEWACFNRHRLQRGWERPETRQPGGGRMSQG